MTPLWISAGTGFELEWGGRPWLLRLDHGQPGLYSGQEGPLLGLTALAAKGRWDPYAWSGSLVEVSCRFNRVTATYAPAGWETLTVRASWTPIDARTLDYEVQIQAFTVDRLHGIEVLTLSTWGQPDPQGGLTTVVPRDERALVLCGDGRHLMPESLRIEPARGAQAAPSWSVSGPGEDRYVEVVHPHDESRQLRDTTHPSVRHALFGYDVEKGIVLRARMRGAWLPASEPVATQAQGLLKGVLEAPLPLGT